MKRILPHFLALSLPVLLIQGCAYLSSSTVKDKTGIETTKVRIYTLFDSQSAVAKFKNGPTGTTIGSVTESSSSTNLNSLVEAVVGAAVRAAK